MAVSRTALEWACAMRVVVGPVSSTIKSAKGPHWNARRERAILWSVEPPRAGGKLPTVIS
jgi:hypothetical protein